MNMKGTASSPKKSVSKGMNTGAAGEGASAFLDARRVRTNTATRVTTPAAKSTAAPAPPCAWLTFIQPTTVATQAKALMTTASANARGWIIGRPLLLITVHELPIRQRVPVEQHEQRVAEEELVLSVIE